jgi:hypothetical protein
MISASFSIGIFIFLTSTYFLAKFFFVDRKGPPVPTGSSSMILSLLYVVLVIASQLFINVRNSSDHCNGTPQIVTAFIYTIIPNFFILGLVMLLMKVLPGWKAPFSNTIGYGVVYMLGVGDAFSDLLKSKKTGALIQKICDDKAIVINEITPFNFEVFVDRLGKDKLLKSGYRHKSAYSKLWEFVVIKDSVAEFTWLMLSGILVISTTFNTLLEISCDIPTAQRKAATAKFEAEEAKAKSKQSKPKLYTVAD